MSTVTGIIDGVGSLGAACGQIIVTFENFITLRLASQSNTMAGM